MTESRPSSAYLNQAPCQTHETVMAGICRHIKAPCWPCMLAPFHVCLGELGTHGGSLAKSGVHLQRVTAMQGQNYWNRLNYACRLVLLVNVRTQATRGPGGLPLGLLGEALPAERPGPGVRLLRRQRLTP